MIDHIFEQRLRRDLGLRAPARPLPLPPCHPAKSTSPAIDLYTGCGRSRGSAERLAPGCRRGRARWLAKGRVEEEAPKPAQSTGLVPDPDTSSCGKVMGSAEYVEFRFSASGSTLPGVRCPFGDRTVRCSTPRFTVPGDRSRRDTITPVTPSFHDLFAVIMPGRLCVVCATQQSQICFPVLSVFAERLDVVELHQPSLRAAATRLVGERTLVPIPLGHLSLDLCRDVLIVPDP